MTITTLLMLAATLSPFAVGNGISEDVEGSNETISSVESVESEVSEEPQAHVFEYAIKDAAISYRDSEQASYAAASDGQIGSYFLSADGWDEGDDYDILMTIKGNVTTKLESKIVYIYEYKPTLVTFNGVELTAGEDRVYTLKKPAEKGEYDLTIAFTKTIIVNPVDLTHVNWASLLTVQNLMTIGSWVIIVVGILVMYFLNRKYKKRGSTTLEEVKKSLTAEIEKEFGAQVASEISKLFDGTIKVSFDVIMDKINKVDTNQSTLVRCLLLMQENTPEARLAITECLSRLDTSADEDAKKVKAIIEQQMREYDEKVSKRIDAIDAAQKANEKWIEEKEKADAEKVDAEEPKEGKGKPTATDDGGYDGTSI